MLRRTFKYRLYPTRKQERLLLEQLGATREIYNACLEHRIVLWREHGIFIGYLAQSREFTRVRQECPEWFPEGMSRSVQQYALRRLDLAFQAFFRRRRRGEKPGFPRFKGARRWDTLSCQYEKGAHLVQREGEPTRLHWQGIGQIKLKLHRPIPRGSDPKKVEIKRQGRHWFVCVDCLIPQPKRLPKTGNAVGLDLGITPFLTLSNGEQVEGPRAQRKAEQRVATLQREVARKKRNSNRRQKAIQRLARARGYEARVRRDHHFKTAHVLVGRYDVICIEDLNVRGLADSTLAKDVRDQGWAQFTSILADKAEEAGRTLVLVNPRNTSQSCSGCGSLPDVKKSLSQRTHSCAECGLILDRDVNAARNVLRLGESQRGISARGIHLASAA